MEECPEVKQCTGAETCNIKEKKGKEVIPTEELVCRLPG